jgi:hypothetical protein
MEFLIVAPLLLGVITAVIAAKKGHFLSWRLTFCAAACISAGISFPLHAQGYNSSVPVDGWGEYKFGMTRGQVASISRKNGRLYTIEGMQWLLVSTIFANDEDALLHPSRDNSSYGNLYEITLALMEEYWNPCPLDRVIGSLEGKYGQFQINVPRPTQGVVPPYATRTIGSVTISVDFLTMVQHFERNTIECYKPTLTYYKAGLQRTPEPPVLPRGQF